MSARLNLVPVLFNINAPTLREAQVNPQPIRDNRQIVLIPVRDEWFNNEGCDRSSGAPHFNLAHKKIQFTFQCSNKKKLHLHCLQGNKKLRGVFP